MNASSAPDLQAPLEFVPSYQVLVWGGRRMEAFRDDLPDGPVGESWDLSDHARGMSVVASGPLRGRTLSELVRAYPEHLVGEGFRGTQFPLLVKLIDASSPLSVQVHPDDALARQMGVGPNGKTECWLLVGEGGSLYQGTKAGIDRAGFERALAAGRIEDALNRFDCQRGDFFFLPARTVHALGSGCFLYEVQQTSDVTFRVWDWGRLGLDGKPRPTHVRESLESIDFSFSPDGFGPRRPEARLHADGSGHRALAECDHFRVEEWTLYQAEDVTHYDGHRGGVGNGVAVCSVVTCLSGRGRIETATGVAHLRPMQTVLVPAAAHGFRAIAEQAEFRLLHATPHFTNGQ